MLGVRGIAMLRNRLLVVLLTASGVWAADASIGSWKLNVAKSLRRARTKLRLRA
jgi:hypothetical protein